jgi:hypothetical protein
VSGTHKENQKLRQYVQHLQDENNFLKLKFEILLDMVIDMILHNTFNCKVIFQFNVSVISFVVVT